MRFKVARVFFTTWYSFADLPTSHQDKQLTLLPHLVNLDRLVHSPILKPALSNLYSPYLPKNSHPFIYLHLTLNPRHVDVNVHPTKREVRFLNEEEIVAGIVEGLEERLKDAGESRRFLVQVR